MTDPFPNTENATLEIRLKTLFNQLNKVRLSAHPQLYNQQGEIWFDPEKGILYIREGTGTWEIQMNYTPN